MKTFDSKVPGEIFGQKRGRVYGNRSIINFVTVNVAKIRLVRWLNQGSSVDLTCNTNGEQKRLSSILRKGRVATFWINRDMMESEIDLTVWVVLNWVGLKWLRIGSSGWCLC